jgi:NTE family protein
MAADSDRKRVGLALGGGGSRGFAHIGVLKVLEEESIPVDIISGTSIGAVVGGAYASGLSPADLVRKVEEILRSPLSHLPVFQAIEDTPAERKEMGLGDKIGLFFKSQWLFAQALFKPGMMDGEDFHAVVNHFIPNVRIEDAKIPFRAVAADLISGKEVVLSGGSLRRAVMASCAVPGFMPPVKEGEMLLVDGGIVNLVPCSVVRQGGAEVVIGVDVDRDIGADREFQNAIDVYTRAAEIGSFYLSHFRLKEADVVIRPRVGEMKWFDLSHALDAVKEGERCARESMERVRTFIPAQKGQTLFDSLRNLFGKRG